MNTQTIVLNRKNVIEGTNNTKYIYKFPKQLNIKSQEISLALLNMYYSWPNIQSIYNNNIFTYIWWNHLGELTSIQNITIPDGNYSISTLSSYIQSQMLLRGHYLKDANTQNNVYFISLIENPTYYACQITFKSMFARGTDNAGVNYINENPPSQVYDTNGNLMWTGWDYPTTQQYPKIIFTSEGKISEFLGFKPETYPVNASIATSYDILGTIAPQTYPVSALNIQSNLCYSDIAIPNNILYSFSQGSSPYGELINISPINLIWSRIPEGTYSQLELQFIDQDFNKMKILDSQVNIIILIRDIK
jgi:hypothetical protein